MRKFWMTIVMGSFSLIGLAVVGFLFKGSDSTVATQIYLIYCLSVSGGLLTFVTGNTIVHLKGKKE